MSRWFERAPHAASALTAHGAARSASSCSPSSPRSCGATRRTPSTPSNILAGPSRRALGRHRQPRPRHLLPHPGRHPALGDAGAAGDRPRASWSGLVLGTAPFLLGRRSGRLVTATVNVAVAFPGLLLALFFAVIFGVGATGAVLADRPRRRAGVRPALTQTLVAGVAARDYVSAARIAGVGRLRILLRHVLPNIAEPLVVNATIGAGGALLSLRRAVLPRPRRPAAGVRLGPAALRRPRRDLRQPGSPRSPRASRCSSPASRSTSSASRSPRASASRRPSAASRTRSRTWHAVGRARGGAPARCGRRPRPGARRPRPRASASPGRTGRSARCAASPSASARGEARRRRRRVGLGQVAHRARDLATRRGPRPRGRRPARASAAPTCSTADGARAQPRSCSAPRWRWSSRTR